jgi:Flp pilus assembly protein TadG
MRKIFKSNERGAALLETAITIPIILLITVGIFEFGRAYQTWQVLTNATREGARVAVLAATTDAQIQQTVRDYLASGNLPLARSGTVSVTVERSVAMGVNTASRVSVNYPFSFLVLNPIVRMVTPASNTGAAPVTMGAVAIMRNEG